MYTKNRRVYIPQTISLLFTDLFFFTGYRGGNIIVTSDSLMLYIAAIASMNAIVILAIAIRSPVLSFYLLSYLSLYIFGLILITRDEVVLVFMIPSLLLTAYSLYSTRMTGKLTRYVSFILVLIFMLYIGKVFLFTSQPSPAIITFQNLTDKISVIGLPTPLTESYGLFVSTKFADVLLSPVQFFLQLTVASLLVENYHKIFGLLFHGNKLEQKRKKSNSGLISAGYAIVATFSCQCESAIALLPSLTILVVSALELPFFIMSVSFLLMTYLLITRFYSAGRLPVMFRRRKMGLRGRYVIAAPIIIVTQLMAVIGVGYRLEESPFFLFGIGMSMLLNGFLLSYIFEPFLSNYCIKKTISVALTSLSLPLALIWFLPSVTSLSIHNPLFFEAMSYSMTLSGLIIGLVYFNSIDSYGINMTEIFVVAIGFIPLIIYYYSFFLADKVWKFWSLSQQVELALVLWLVMLPIMWIATQRSLADPIISYELYLGSLPSS
jgi:hypothetical protein